MAHALGFSSASWPLFRDSVGAARTPRDLNRPERPTNAYQYSYTCQSSSYSPYIPASTTVNYFQERGATCTYNGTMTPTTNCVHKLVTPAVVAAARFYFNCSTLNGAELENQMTTACDLQGSHWEQRIFSTELMSSYAQHSMQITPMTLAAFEDSGWYRPVYTAADWLRPGSDWGFAQGCNFTANKCLTGTVSVGAPAHFGATTAGTGTFNAMCTTDRRALAFVGISDWTGALPSQYQYFPGFPQRGGSLDVFDYCPAVSAYSNALCNLPTNANGNSQVWASVHSAVRPSRARTHERARGSCRRLVFVTPAVFRRDVQLLVRVPGVDAALDDYLAEPAAGRGLLRRLVRQRRRLHHHHARRQPGHVHHGDVRPCR